MEDEGERTAFAFPDGESFAFQNTPTVILEIDALFPDVPKTVEGTEHFDELREEYACTKEVCQQLKALLLMNV